MGLVEVAMPAITSHLGTLGANRFSSVIPPAYCHSCMGEGVCAEAARAPPTRTAASTHGANSFRNSNAPPPKSTAEEHGRFPARHPATVASCGRGSARVVENDTQGLAPAAAHPADAVAQIHPVITAGAADRAVMDREHDRIAE